MKKIITVLLGSGFGTGYAPIASGTVASLLAFAIYVLMVAKLDYIFFIILTVFVLLISVPVCSWAESYYNQKDDSRIVLDEIIGYFISVIFLPYSIKIALAAFLLFRLFDVLKPLGIRKLQSIKGGFGIVIDDILAGAFANILLQIAVYLKLL